METKVFMTSLISKIMDKDEKLLLLKYSKLSRKLQIKESDKRINELKREPIS
jgi:hypothetical protein